MTLSSPIKSSREGVWSVHAPRARRWKRRNTDARTHALRDGYKAAEGPCMALPPSVCVCGCLPLLQSFGYLKGDMVMLGLVVSSSQFPERRASQKRRRYFQGANLSLMDVGAEVAAAVAFVPHVAPSCPIQCALFIAAPRRDYITINPVIGRIDGPPHSRGFLLADHWSTITDS